MDKGRRGNWDLLREDDVAAWFSQKKKNVERPGDDGLVGPFNRWEDNLTVLPGRYVLMVTLGQ